MALKGQEHGIANLFTPVVNIARGLFAFRKPSLARITDRIHRDHLRGNAASIGLRYGAGRRFLVAVRRHWAIAALITLVVYGVVGGLTALCPPTLYGPQVPDGLGDYFRDLQTINLGLLGAQATLLGLVYPLVIALVGMLFETRSSTGHRLHIYFSETEAAAVGGLALSYIAWVALQSLFYGQLELKVVGAATVLNVLWFVVNLAALAFFVRRSLDFIQPERRVRLTRSYVANTAWKEQLRDLILGNRWLHAREYGYLPKEAADGEFDITPFMNAGDLVTRSFSKPHQLVDVRLGVLSVALKARARRLKPGAEEDAQTTLSAWPAQTYAAKVALVRGTGDVSGSERWLFQRAFRFERVRPVDPVPTTQGLLTEGGADLVALMDAGRLDDFRARLRELIEQHGLYYQLAQTPQVEGEPPFNYGAMPSGLDALSVEWIQAYKSLLDRFGERLPNEARFFDSAANLAARLQHRIGSAPADAMRALFFIPMRLARALLTRAGRERALTPAGGAGTFTVTGPVAEPYGRAWQDLVGGWESFADAIAPLTRSGVTPTWTDLRALSPTLARHLRDSAMMVAMAAQSGETTAIRWTVDLMLKWDERVRRVWPTSAQSWMMDRRLPTLGLMSNDWETVSARPWRDDRKAEPIEVFDAAVENAWRDTLLVLVCSLIATSRSPSPGVIDDGAALAACALFQNREFDPGASYHPRSAPLTTEAILRSILRLAGNGNVDESYGGTIENLAEQIGGLEGPNYISGRVYGWVGGAGGGWGHTTTHDLLLAASLPPAVPGRRAGSTSVDSLNSLLLTPSDEDRRAIFGHLEAMRDALPGLDRTQGAALASALTASSIDGPNLEERLERVGELIEACLVTINTAREAVLATAAVDTAKLEALALAAQSKAFTAEEGGFPLSGFRTIETSDEALKPMVYHLNNVRRGAYVTPPMDQAVSNEDEWWAEEMVGRVGEIVLLDVLAASAPRRRRPRKPDTYWRALVSALDAIRAEGQTPVIVRPHRQAPKCLWDWTLDAGTRPEGLVLENRPGQEKGYDFHLNDTAVYSSRAANGATWVFGIERLDTLTFQSFGEGRLAKAELVPDPGRTWRGTVSLTWGRKVVLSDGLAFRISHPPVL